MLANSKTKISAYSAVMVLMVFCCTNTVQAANAEHSAIKTERVLALRKLRSGFELAEAQYKRLRDRQALYRT